MGRRGSFSGGRELDEEDEDELEEKSLIAGPSAGGSMRKRVRMSFPPPPLAFAQDEQMEGVEEEEKEEEGRELDEVAGEDETSSPGWKMPAGSNRFGGRSMGAMDFLVSRGNGMHRGVRRKGAMGAQGVRASGASDFPFHHSPFCLS